MILCILGSGGHTTELFTLIQSIDSEFVFIGSRGDLLSRIKSMREHPNAKYYTIIRPRLPAQHIIASLPRMLVSFLHTLLVVALIKSNHRIKVVIGNGPGICVFIFFLFRLLRTTTVYVESFARVNSLSLTGKIVKKFSSYFIVQWKENEGLAMEWVV
eukprot:NODE_441_length_8548_cov_0.413185.p3 type:complete len:158 gc:universal NODE_441_length_8548_cov_0.413185:3277-2804(-)